jgi:hypothetical protein
MQGGRSVHAERRRPAAATGPLKGRAARPLAPVRAMACGVLVSAYRKNGRFPAGLQDGPRRHRVEAARLALPLQSIEGLAQVQEPGSASGEAGGGGRLGEMICTYSLVRGSRFGVPKEKLGGRESFPSACARTTARSFSGRPARWASKASCRSAPLALPLQSIEGLAQVQEPGSASGEAGGGGRLGEMICTYSLKRER